MRYILTIFVLFLYVNAGWTQDRSAAYSDTLTTELGMNMTALINQLVPFKQITNKTGPYAASLKVIRGANAFRTAIGIHAITENFGQTNILNFNLRLGFERRRYVNERFVFYQTFDLLMMAGNFNMPINDFEGTDQAGAGLGLGLGIEYNIYNNLSLSTESIGFVGIIGGTSSIVNITVIPPISVFLNYKF